MEIKIKTTLWVDEITKDPYITNVIGSLIDNKITYIDDTVKVAIILKSDKITLSRENDDYLITLNFNEIGSNYYLKSEDKNLPLNVITHKLVLKENSFYIKYELEKRITTFVLEYEVIS